MTIDDIILELAADDGLPRQTIRYCLDHPDEVVPTFISILTRASDERGVTPEAFDALFLIVHILGDLRERQAYRPLVKLLRKDEETLDELFGDALTETLPKILISVFDGDPEPLYRLIEDAEADDAARDTAFAAWTFWAATGGLNEQEARDRLSQWLNSLEPRSESLVWSGWIEAVAVLGFEDMADTVQAIINKGFLPERLMAFSDFQRLLNESLRGDRAAFMTRRRMEPFADIIGTLSAWHGFSDAYVREQRRRRWNWRGLRGLRILFGTLVATIPARAGQARNSRSAVCTESDLSVAEVRETPSRREPTSLPCQGSDRW